MFIVITDRDLAFVALNELLITSSLSFFLDCKFHEDGYNVSLGHTASLVLQHDRSSINARLMNGINDFGYFNPVGAQ